MPRASSLFRRLLIVGLVGYSVTSLGAATRLPFKADFENNSFAGWSGGRTPTMSIVRGGAASGNYSVRATMPGGSTLTDNYQDFFFGDHGAVRGTPATGELWLKLASKVDSDFNFGSSPLNKIAIINFTDTSTQRRRYQILITLSRDTRQYFVENLMWNADGSFGRTVSALTQNTANRPQLRPGQWDQLKLRMKPNTPGKNDGIIQLWVNGQLTMDYKNVPMRENTSFNPNVLIMSNYTYAGGTQWWDDFYLSETDPDAGQVADSPPMAPQIKSITPY